MTMKPLCMSTLLCILLCNNAWPGSAGPPGSICPPGKSRPSRVGNPLADATNKFTLKLFRRLAADHRFYNTSIFYSPVSIALALGMTHLGARGQTSTQLMRAFEWKSRRLNYYFRKLSESLNHPTDAELVLKLANRIWAQRGMSVLRRFERRTQYYFGSQMVQADFARNAERVREEINGWVENKTEHKIKELLKRGMVDALTRMVLVNAIYFKGTWKYQFEEKKTRKHNFYIDGRRTVLVDMMTQKNNFSYIRDFRAGYDVLELPYTGDEASMFIVLPTRYGTAGLRSVERGLTTASIERWVQPRRQIEMRVFIPKFKLTHSFSAVPYLKAMGVRDLFSSRDADLSGITGSRGLYVSDVVHKAFVEVNEKGTEAAAATAVVMKRSGTQSFVANRPFLFFIYHKKAKTVLFFGRVMRPDQEQVG